MPLFPKGDSNMYRVIRVCSIVCAFCLVLAIGMAEEKQGKMRTYAEYTGKMQRFEPEQLQLYLGEDGPTTGVTLRPETMIWSRVEIDREDLEDGTFIETVGSRNREENLQWANHVHVYPSHDGRICFAASRTLQGWLRWKAGDPWLEVRRDGKSQEILLKLRPKTKYFVLASPADLQPGRVVEVLVSEDPDGSIWGRRIRLTEPAEGGAVDNPAGP